MYSVPTPRCFYDHKQMLNLKKLELISSSTFVSTWYWVRVTMHPSNRCTRHISKERENIYKNITRKMFCTHVRQLHCILTIINETGKKQSLIKQSLGTLYWQTSMRLEKNNRWQKKSSGTFAWDAGGGESERGTTAGLDEDHIYHHKD